MSLHLGNLSSRVRRDEIERVFRRFGQCNVRVKDKFGFVDYDYPRNAENALKTLRGKFICGEPISLSWSNRQPRSLQKYARGVKSFEAVRRKHSATEDYIDREVGSNRGQGSREGFRQGNGSERPYADIMDEACHENMKDYEDHRPSVDVFSDHGVGVDAGLSGNNRWHEQIINRMNENVVEDGSDFDRYEPTEADEQKEQNILIHRDGSSSLRKPEQKAGMEQTEQISLNHSNDPKTQNACYSCGEAGHEMRKSPQGFKRLESRTSRRLRDGHQKVSLRITKGTREANDSRNGLTLRSEPSPSATPTHRGGINNHRENKRSWKEHRSTEKFHPKKARVSLLPSTHSNNTASRSWSSSRSMRSLSRSPSPSRSKLASSIKDSPSSSSQSGSTTLNTRSKCFKSNLKSRYSSPTSSLSPKKVQIDQQGCFVDVGDPQSKGVLSEGERLENSAARLDDSKLENVTIEVENQSEAAAFELEENVEDDYSQRRDAIDRDSNSCLGNNANTSGSDTGDPTAWGVSPKSLTKTMELQKNDAVAEQAWAQNQNSGLAVSERLVSERFHAASLTSLSAEEVYRVLKHYGLESQEKRENELPLETYFGCSRLWPWEIIFYRRLKKGLISTENYSRRLAQNKEFGIVDKFVRSSSGWGELREENS